MKLFYVLCFAAILISCDSNPYNCTVDSSLLAKNDSLLKRNEQSYGLTLKEYEEPELPSSKKKSYRLLVHHSLDRNTRIYRFEKTDAGGILILKRYYDKYYSEAHDLISTDPDAAIQKELTQEQWSEIENVFNSNCFWTLPGDIDRQGLDGRTCLLEAFDPESRNPANKDHFIAVRWSPEANTEFRKICDYIESMNP